MTGEGGLRVEHPRRITDDNHIPLGGTPTVLTAVEIPKLQAELLQHWRDRNRDTGNDNSVSYLRKKRMKDAADEETRKAWEEASEDMIIRKVVRPARKAWKSLNT
jgi:hypothetical protein